MKSNTAVQNLLLNSDAIRAVPEVIIDWNMNRYVGAVASNVAGAGVAEFDAEYFPVESIVEPRRPTKGINKARVGSATIGDDYKVGGAATPNGRFYIADADDIYKYWTSPTPSDATGALANAKPQVVYAATTAINKIVITLENTWATPKTFQIQTTTAANPGEASWTTVATETTTPAGWKGTGQIVLYWNGTNWTNTTRSANTVTTNVRGIRIVVTALEGGYRLAPDGSAVATTYGSYTGSTYTTSNTTGFNSYFDLIEISARLEVDISDSVITVADNSDMGEVDQLYPIGTITTNQGTLTLSNLMQDSNGDWVPGLFDKNNSASPYKNYIEANARVNVSYKFYDEDDVFIGTVQQFRMYTETWTDQTTDTVTVNLSDFSKFLNVENVRPVMWENLTVPQIIWRLMDSMGCTNYAIDAGDFVTEHTIPVFYTDGESTLWEVLDSLAQASQTAIYFDSFGILQVRTRDYAFSPTDTPVWRFTAGVVGDTKLSDIAELQQTEEFAPNHYTISYQKTNWSEANRAGQPTMQKVWEPEDTVVLRASPLYRSMTDTDTLFYLEPKEAKTWPYEGIVNIDGEVMRFKGKEYVYYTGSTGGTENKVIIESFDDSERRNAETPVEYRHKNHFSGAFNITERGMWDSSVAKPHSKDIANYSVRGRVNNNNKTNVSGIRHLKKDSRLLVNPPKQFTSYKDVMVATIGNTDDTTFYDYGTKMRFVRGKGQKTQCAGITFNNSGAGEGDGYYIEFTPSKNLSGKDRKSRHELIIYSRTGNKDKRLGGKGQALPIAENVDFEVDVHFTTGTEHKISVWVNGKKALSVTVAGANRQGANGRFGVFARGKTKTEHEYLYGIRNMPDEPMDDFSFMDKMQGAYSGQQWDRNWVHGWKDYPRKVRKKTKNKGYRLNDYFIDEFGPVVHEIREYDVKFDPAPVLHSRIYNTNDWSSVVLEYKGNPFGAKFILANTSRNNAVLNGDDSISFAGTGDSVGQVLTVFGRALVVEEAEQVIAKNDDQVKRRGKIESEISNEWIQSKDMAIDLRDWLVDTFSYGNEQLELRVFGNPLIEVSDVVTVQYPSKYINADYFVVGIDSEYDQGLSTTLTLRKRVRTS